MYIYIYIYIQREREREVHTYYDIIVHYIILYDAALAQKGGDARVVVSMFYIRNTNDNNVNNVHMNNHTVH